MKFSNSASVEVKTVTLMIGFRISKKEAAGSEINFLTWMYFAVPVSIISNILCWMWLLANYVGVGKETKKRNYGLSDSSLS